MNENLLATGRLLDNYQVITLPATTSVTRTLLVPSNERWWIINGIQYNGDNVTRHCRAELLTLSSELILSLCALSDLTAGAAKDLFNTVASVTQPIDDWIPAKATDQVVIYWTVDEVSAGGTGYSSLLVLEVAI